MKNLSIITLAAILLCACSTQITEQDYKDALINYVENNNESITPESIALTLTQELTVKDSIDYLTYTLAEEYNTLLAEKKQAWEDKQADCEKDEKANILRHEDYMKKYNDAKRKYGNDIKYKSKIEGYLKAAQKLPSTHEEYLDFDRRRSYSFTRDAENLKADYEQFLQLGLENWAAQHPFITKYDERDKAEVVGCVYQVNYTTAEGEAVVADFIFSHTPLSVAEQITGEGINIVNYKQAQEAVEEATTEE